MHMRRRARFCSDVLTMTLRLRSPAIALRQEGLDVREADVYSILHQPWPCGRSRRAWAGCNIYISHK